MWYLLPQWRNKHVNFGALKYFNRWQSSLWDLESPFYHTAETIFSRVYLLWYTTRLIFYFHYISFYCIILLYLNVSIQHLAAIRNKPLIDWFDHPKISTFDAVYLDCLPRTSDSVVIPDIERLEASIMFTIVLWIRSRVIAPSSTSEF